ncbi:hypothetical protein [Actinopolyspora mortivallis]|uniref:hypothetical protein n=1 Tax=Actinopolyspora mortivallis TaxID=33906 RepID=UPI002158EFF3|nr:hypothetical protein [Actinopolyspora mortivallis]
MSLPGGSNNWHGTDSSGRHYYDPLSGQPLSHEGGQPQHPVPPRSGTGRSGPYSADPGTSGRFPSDPQTSGSAGAGAGRESLLRRYGPTIAVASTAVASVITIVTTLVLVKPWDGSTVGGAGAAATSASAAPSTPVSPLEPGWQAVAVRDAGIAYDVPPLWETDHEGITGFETESGRRMALTNYSTFLDGFCSQASTSYRAIVGLTSVEKSDSASAAEHVLRRIAELGWTTPEGAPPKTELDDPRPVELDGGAITGSFLSGTVVPESVGPCGAPSTYIGVVTVSTDRGSVALVGIADQETVASVSPEEIDRSLESLRLI